MKTIFRYTNAAVLLAALIVFGAVAGFAQNATPAPGPCADAAGMAALDAKFRDNYNKGLAERKTAVEAGKQYLEKYGDCGETNKEFVDYLKARLPKMEEKIKTDEIQAEKDKLTKRFDTALAAKNWDEVYAAGKEVLAKYPDEYRDVELALGTIGFDETYNKNNFKYNDDTLKYARMAISDLEAGKKFSANYGFADFLYTSKENALGWMNMTVGYITAVAQKNRATALPYLYKATQSTSTTPNSTAKNPIPYEQIGNYYFDELNKLSTEITAMIADQKESDTPEVVKQKVDAIKAKVAISNGTSERAMDAFSRAYSLSKTTPETKPYRDKMRKFVDDAYKRRFGKTEGVDAWIAATVKKPFADPTTPVTPISDPEPTAPAAATSTTTTTTPPAKPETPAAKPATVPAKPATAKPVAGAKPQAKLKKTAAKKKGA